MTVQSNTSLFKPGMAVALDPWSVNPLLDDANQSVPDTVKLATITNGNPPTMFVTGDIPPFVASGVDAQFLLSLPWQVRHAAAMEPDATRMLTMLEQYATDGDAAVPTQGLSEYVSRFRDWLSGKWTNPSFTGAGAAQQADAEDAFYNSMFGAQEAAHTQKLAAIAASNPARARPATDWQTDIGRAHR